MGRDFSFAGRSSDAKTPGADAPGVFWKGEIGGLLNRNVVNDGRTADGQPQALDAILNQYNRVLGEQRDYILFFFHEVILDLMQLGNVLIMIGDLISLFYHLIQNRIGDSLAAIDLGIGGEQLEVAQRVGGIVVGVRNFAS